MGDCILYLEERKGRSDMIAVFRAMKYRDVRIMLA